jgi:hypothetical protein
VPKAYFLKTFFRAVFALSISALILFAVIVCFSAPGIFEATDREQPFEVAGKSMRAVIGTAESRGQQLAITAYQAQGSEYHAIVVWHGLLHTDSYPLLRYQVDAHYPGPALKLIWRTSSNPEEFYSVDLNRMNNAATWQNMSRNPNWQGNLVEVGIYVVANAADQPLSISSLTFEPLSWRGVVASLWSDWMGFRGWTTKSINYLYGTADSTAPSPVVAVAAWAALAVALLWIMGLYSGGIRPAALVAVLLVPWISMDMLWQKELATQLEQTRYQFAGKTIHEKHLADIDSHVYRYIMRLKDEVLPPGPSRIVILHESRGHNFERLKAQYYLLPNNVYNRGNRLPDVNADNTDYILVLGEVPRVKFNAKDNTLVSRSGKRKLRVETLDRDAMGTLYRALPWQPGGGEN